MSNKLSLYVGCSLTHAPERFKSDVEKLKKDLEKDYNVLHFLGLEKGTVGKVYQNDIGYVASCDIFLAICDYPSLGLGYELATAVEKYQKPTLAVAREGALVTRLILGIKQPNFSFKRYRQLSDIEVLLSRVKV